MSSVNVQRRTWCEQNRANVSVESSTSLDRQQRGPDGRTELLMKLHLTATGCHLPYGITRQQHHTSVTYPGLTPARQAGNSVLRTFAILGQIK